MNISSRVRTYMVTAYTPVSRQNGRFRTIGVVARDDVEASQTAAKALLAELRDPSLSNLFEIVTVTALPDRTVVFDASGQGYVVTVLLAPIGGNIAA
jgi:hypothetical protein